MSFIMIFFRYIHYWNQAKMQHWKFKMLQCWNEMVNKLNLMIIKVKLTVLIEYFKSCTILFSVLFMIFYVLMNVAQSAVSIYLSDWSNNADNPDDNKYVRLGVYTALGLAQCNICLFIWSEQFFLTWIKIVVYLLDKLYIRLYLSKIRWCCSEICVI